MGNHKNKLSREKEITCNRTSILDIFRSDCSSLPTTAYKLKPADLKYLSQQTSLSNEAINQIFTRFCDENVSGYLSKSEFVKFYCSLRDEPDEKIRQIAEFAFNAFDKDKNGTAKHIQLFAN